MKKNFNNLSYERTIKNLKDTIESLKKENLRLLSENKTANEIIKTLQEEKFEISKKLIDYESEILYKVHKNKKEDILLYNPKHPSKNDLKFSLIKQSFNLKLGAGGKSHDKSLSTQKKNKNIINILNSKKDLAMEQSIAFNIINNIISNNENEDKFNYKSGNKNTLNNIKNYTNKYTNTFSYTGSQSSKDGKNKNCNYNSDTVIDESQFSLKKNIDKEIENILEEKKKNKIKNLKIENFSFDLICYNNKVINQIDLDDINKLIEIVQNRKKIVINAKKNLKKTLY